MRQGFCLYLLTAGTGKKSFERIQVEGQTVGRKGKMEAALRWKLGDVPQCVQNWSLLQIVKEDKSLGDDSHILFDLPVDS